MKYQTYIAPPLWATAHTNMEIKNIYCILYIHNYVLYIIQHEKLQDTADQAPTLLMMYKINILWVVIMLMLMFCFCFFRLLCDMEKEQGYLLN